MDTPSLRARHFEKQLGWQEMLVPELLRTVRNALEHLVDAQFVDERAESPASNGQKGSALRRLNGLDIALGGESVFGHIDPADVEAAALQVVRGSEQDLADEAFDQYIALLD
ncbi:hypothetical protein [Streptomyces sp. NRRL S-646]|uniref:hypothetical protein n=1 Tax=Streptomyces sp. NRRL S-646 TaxID=1463917 RepID=UPI0004CA7F02|nr:hypothetical protein [Streptomyces sp. NRRL S-646]